MRRDGAAVEHQPALVLGDDRVDDARAIWAPRWSIRRSDRSRHERFGVRVGINGPDAPPTVSIGYKGDRSAIRRPCGCEVVARVVGNLADRAGAGLELPDVVVTRAIRRERDAVAVRRPGRLAVVERAGGQARQRAAVRVHGPDVPCAVPVGLKRYLLALRRPHRLARGLHVLVSNSSRSSAARGKRPQAAKGDRWRASCHRARAQPPSTYLRGARA